MRAIRRLPTFKQHQRILVCTCKSRSRSLSVQAAPGHRLNHLEQTQGIERENNGFVGTVARIVQESPTVKRVDFTVPDGFRSSADFKPGQWLDVEFDGVDTVGGFSLCSDPEQVIDSTKTGLVSIAVKMARHPPARHVHEGLAVGDSVQLTVGGDWHFDTNDPWQQAERDILALGMTVAPPSFQGDVRQRIEERLWRLQQWKQVKPIPRLVCIGGGIGLSPLVPIAAAHHGAVLEALCAGGLARSDPDRAETVVLASSRGLDESVFLGSLAGMVRREKKLKEDGSVGLPAAPLLKVVAADTSDQSNSDSVTNYRKHSVGAVVDPMKGVDLMVGRLDAGHLREAVWGRKDGDAPQVGNAAQMFASSSEHRTEIDVPPLAFLCGPPAMIDWVADTLMRPWSQGGVGLPTECVVYEKWW